MVWGWVYVHRAIRDVAVLISFNSSLSDDGSL